MLLGRRWFLVWALIGVACRENRQRHQNPEGDMTQDSLYRELRPDVQSLAQPLFDTSKVFLKNRGGFLPHGATLNSAGQIGLQMASPAELDQKVSSTEVLPFLQESLRVAARQNDLRALATCEDVRITLAGNSDTSAIKVVVEHSRGLCVALYLPYRRDSASGFVYGEVIVKAVPPETRAWQK
jgi:hypothetical protein